LQRDSVDGSHFRSGGGIVLTKQSGFKLPWRFPILDDREAVFATVALLVAVLLIYSNSLHGEWHFDDFHNIVENRCIQMNNLNAEELSRSFYGLTCDDAGRKISRPLAYASFALNYFFGGLSLPGYHAINVGIHGLAAVLLFFLVRLTLALPPLRERYGDIASAVALLSAFLWATSPLHVHAVTIVVQRMASLAGLFFVLSLYGYARARTAQARRAQIAWGTLCGACALAGFATKENTAVLPVTLWLYELYFIQGVSASSARRSLKWAIVPAAAVVALGLLYTDFTLQRATYEIGVRPFSPLERLLTQTRVLFLYAGLLLYPIPSRLTLLHDIEISRGLADPWTTLAAVLGIALSLGFAIAKARRYPLLSFAILFFFLNHLVEGTVIPLELIFEHRNYIPSMFFFVPLSVLMILCLDYFAYRRGIQAFMAGGFALLLAFQAHSTFERNDVVRSDLHLWLDNVQKAPDLSRPRINLAKHYYEAGLYEEAYAEFRKAEELNRDTNLRQVGVASYGLGLYYLYQAKDVTRAEQQFARALERFPGYPPAIAGMAKTRLKNGDVEGAWEWMRAWLPRSMNNVEMLNCAALVLLKQGNARDALKLAARSLELKWNDPQPWELSGEAWRMLGQWEKAAQCWEEALRLNPLNPRAILALLDIRDRLRDETACAPLAARCLVLKGDASLEEWLGSLTRNASETAYEVKPGRMAELIRKTVRRELTPGKS
jgi:tetratricopeptide (TPR) repeat protein